MPGYKQIVQKNVVIQFIRLNQDIEQISSSKHAGKVVMYFLYVFNFKYKCLRYNPVLNISFTPRYPLTVNTYRVYRVYMMITNKEVHDVIT